MSRRKIIFLAGLVLIQLSLVWPVYPVFSDIYPLILGIPLSFAWVIFILLSAFSLLLWYYLTEPEQGDGTLNSGGG
jgi:membrane protein implicated in regulation of membrane protease activity